MEPPGVAFFKIISFINLSYKEEADPEAHMDVPAFPAAKTPNWHFYAGLSRLSMTLTVPPQQEHGAFSAAEPKTPV